MAWLQGLQKGMIKADCTIRNIFRVRYILFQILAKIKIIFVTGDYERKITKFINPAVCHLFTSSG